jgi:IclR helix-turn-helix domain
MSREAHKQPHRTYWVPVVVKTIHMVEILRTSSTGFRVGDLRAMTRYPTSTIYRVLRTLVSCKWLVRVRGGVYRIDHNVIPLSHSTREEYSGGWMGDEMAIALEMSAVPLDLTRANVLDKQEI